MNLPTLILGAVSALSGVILFALAPQSHQDPFAASSAAVTEQQFAYDRDKWNALLKYDDDIAMVAEKLKSLGPKWTDEFASSFLALNDKKYLSNIVQKIIAEARKEAAENRLPPLEGQENLRFRLTPKATEILQRAIANGYEVNLSAQERCVVARLKGLSGTWYLGSNDQIYAFDRDTASRFVRRK